MDFESYLKRIGFTGERKPTKNLLFELQKRHLFSVPFENLDIHRGKKISLDLVQIYEKIVNKRRGGYCFELNGLFHWLLKMLGFEADIVLGGVWLFTKNDWNPIRTHIAIVVNNLEGERYLVDVGYGDPAAEPLRMQIGLEQETFDGFRFRISRFNQEFLFQEKWSRPSSEWIRRYCFDLRPVELESLTDANEWVQTNPESRFVNGVIVTICSSEGRVTLANMRLIITGSDGNRAERIVEKEEEYVELLRVKFGIVLDRVESESDLSLEIAKKSPEIIWSHVYRFN